MPVDTVVCERFVSVTKPHVKELYVKEPCVSKFCLTKLRATMLCVRDIGPHFAPVSSQVLCSGNFGLRLRAPISSKCTSEEHPKNYFGMLCQRLGFHFVLNKF
jgi:hypothetical protein